MTKKLMQKIPEVVDYTDTHEMLLRGVHEDLTRMDKAKLRQECLMWRQIWNWVPSEVKYYVARCGSTIAITMRNYKRYMGTLLDTHWILDEIELGVYDKVYDTVTGENYFERKIIKTRMGGIIDLQFIAEREREEDVLGIKTEPTEEELGEQDIREIKAEDVEKRYGEGSNIES